MRCCRIVGDNNECGGVDPDADDNDGDGDGDICHIMILSLNIYSILSKC